MLYKELVEVCGLLESTSKRLDKTYYLSVLIKKSPDSDLQTILKLLRGKIFPEWDDRKIGVAARLVLKSIHISTGISINKLEKAWKSLGDLGDVAKKFIGKKVQSTLFSDDLTISKVYNNLVKLATHKGAGTVDYKVKLICELLSNASPEEARFIVRTVLEETRVGVGDGTIRDAIVWSAFPKILGIFYKCKECGEYMPNIPKCIKCDSKIENKFKKEYAVFNEEKTLKVDNIDNLRKIQDFSSYDFILPITEELSRECYDYFLGTVQHAYDLSNDFGEVALSAKIGITELNKFKLVPGKPIKVMLAQKVSDVTQGFEKVGKPCALEFKYDGFRIQCHKKDGKISLYTRRLENVTKQFPDVVSALKEHVNAEEFILDSEAVGYNPKTTQYMPFQAISQRIKRKYDTEEIAKKIPVELNVFDIMYVDGKDMISEPFSKRREMLTNIIQPIERKIVVSRIILTDDEKEASEFYHKSLDAGNEGIMLKKLDAIYKPGSRVGFMIKLKPVMETLDLVIVGATWGEGKRASWLTSFTIACMGDDGEYLEIGKVGTGIKELDGEGVTFSYLTELLRPLITWEKGVDIKVRPEVVIEINYEEIQKSKSYSSGYALRFPRLKVLREERAATDISSLETVEDLFHNQRNR